MTNFEVCRTAGQQTYRSDHSPRDDLEPSIEYMPPNAPFRQPFSEPSFWLVGTGNSFPFRSPPAAGVVIPPPCDAQSSSQMFVMHFRVIFLHLGEAPNADPCPAVSRRTRLAVRRCVLCLGASEQTISNLRTIFSSILQHAPRCQGTGRAPEKAPHDDINSIGVLADPEQPSHLPQCSQTYSQPSTNPRSPGTTPSAARSSSHSSIKPSSSCLNLENDWAKGGASSLSRLRSSHGSDSKS